MAGLLALFLPFRCVRCLGVERRSKSERSAQRARRRHTMHRMGDPLEKRQARASDSCSISCFVQHLVQKWAGKIDPATGKFREEFARIMAQAISLARSVTAKQLMSLVFDALDANGDGRLSKDEFLRAAVALGEKVLSDWKEIHNG
eukprot:jgi/Bigna1/83956/fgenesh1_pg.119_\